MRIPRVLSFFFATGQRSKIQCKKTLAYDMAYGLAADDLVGGAAWM